MKKNVIWAIVFLLVFMWLVFKPESKDLPYFKHETDMLQVDITGAVKKPGTYQITRGMTLAYLIDLSGGLKEHADISNIQLGSIVTNATYHIPHYQLIEEEIIKKINLNTATYSELVLIPYITENRALEILLYKKEHGNFKSLEELLHVKGIGVQTFDKIKIYFFI